MWQPRNWKIARQLWKEGQKVIHNIPGKRGIRMDFVAESEDGRVFDVEMQNRKEIFQNEPDSIRH